MRVGTPLSKSHLMSERRSLSLVRFYLILARALVSYAETDVLGAVVAAAVKVVMMRLRRLQEV